MSINKMLIDATHPEETRVVVLRENRVEEFDYESAARKLLRGSIYLAKITRVEPSLQAAFVDYGGNRHGFLAFSEVHPDYYQIPHADKLALLEQQSREQAEYEAALDGDDGIADDDDADGSGSPTQATSRSAPPGDSSDNTGGNDSAELDASDDYDFEANAIDVSHLIPDAAHDQPAGAVVDDGRTDSEGARPHTAEVDGDDRPRSASLAASLATTDVKRQDVDTLEAGASDTSEDADDHIDIRADSVEHGDDGRDSRLAIDDVEIDDTVESLNDGDDDDDDTIATLDGDDDTDDVDEGEGTSGARPARARARRSQRPRRSVRQYKIQEVIKRRQIVLIQVVKEERGNKGAALTTYLSLAGRYTVLMPNTARGGGISRKITNIQDRKRLKAIAQELDVPEGMGLIIRTAGAARTRQEICRDYEYLLRLWENVRNLTLESTAPSLVYGEGNLIKRSIRDLYTKEIDEVLVAGEEALKEAKNFMRMLMPSHAKNVVKHEGGQSLFAKFRIEQQLNAMFSPSVQLRSGGYLVINQTEALVAIDVNSGKSTREFSIEETALKTNLEAADEVARQLKLRDLAGLIVVDFIDMEENRNNRAVERRLKDALRADRARIQVGRISHFGLLEMSRQRLRTGVLEGSTTQCEHCQGTGMIRSIESVSLAVLRGLEDALVSGRMRSCVTSCASDVALYLLNQKRLFIQELEERYEVTIHVRASAKQQGASFLIEPLETDEPVRRRPVREAVNVDAGFVAATDDDNEDTERTERTERIERADRTERTERTEDSKPRRRRRRRGGRRDDEVDVEAQLDDEGVATLAADGDDDGEDGGDEAETASNADADGEDQRPRRSRRRGRRGGRRHRDQRAEADVAMPGAAQPRLLSDAPSEADDLEDVNGAVAPQAAIVSEIRAERHVASAPHQSNDRPSAPSAPHAGGRPGGDGDGSGGDEKPEDEPDSGTVSSRIATSVELPLAVSAGAATTTVAAPPANEPSRAESPANGTMTSAALDADTLEAERPTQDEAATDRPSRAEPSASEPILQRLFVGPNRTNADTVGSSQQSTDAEAGAPQQADKSSRRGWWRRT